MQTFIDARQMDEIIEECVEVGWLVRLGEGDEAQLTLTDAGKAERETAFEVQSEVSSPGANRVWPRAAVGPAPQGYPPLLLAPHD